MIAQVGDFCKYDGTNFYQYNYKNSKIENSCLSIFENKEGIWFGFFDKPLLRFQNNTFYEYSLFPNKKQRVYDIKENKNGLWITNYGKELINIKNNKIRTFTAKNGLPTNSAYKIFIDKKKNIWIATLFNGVYRIDENIFKMNDWQNEIPIISIAGIVKDKDNKIWYLPNGGKIVREDSLYYTSFINQSNEMVLPLRHVWDAEFSNDGTVWLGTYNSGIAKFNYTNFTFYKFEKGNIILDISSSENKNIWFATKRTADKI